MSTTAVAMIAASVIATAAPMARKNFLLIAVDDLRPMFGKSFGVEEVLTPNLDRHFLDGGGSAMQHSCVATLPFWERFFVYEHGPTLRTLSDVTRILLKRNAVHAVCFLHWRTSCAPLVPMVMLF